MYNIEFQKRGLPHAHMLFILDKNSKLNTAEKIDNHISAEIPEDPVLREIVLRCMIHGPCSESRCKNSKGECTKKIPMQYRKHTLLERDGYPEYRRSEGTQTEQPVPWTSMAGSKRAERPTSILGPKRKEHLVLGKMQ